MNEDDRKKQVDALLQRAIAAMTEGPRARESKNVLSPSRLDAEIQAERLRDNFAALSQTHEFKPGDIVEVKPGLSGQWRIPADGQAAIVTKVFDPPLIDPHANAGETSFGREFTVAILLIDSQGDVIEFAFDGRYLQPFGGAK